MISIENVEVVGWEHAIRGMRNPMNSWGKSDSFVCNKMLAIFGDCPMVEYDCENAMECSNGENGFCVGENDFSLIKKLAKAGTDHRKFMRMIVVYADITAPLYWWKEFDTYKVGTVRNSCSTMHKIHDEEFTIDDFSCEHLIDDCNDDCTIYPYMSDSYYGGWTPNDFLEAVIESLNKTRELYIETKDKRYWWQMIQLLPSSYNQKATVMLNYEVLANMYHSRKNHKLDEWCEFCKWIESLPYSEVITCGGV